jgi:hypothetical protein
MSFLDPLPYWAAEKMAGYQHCEESLARTRRELRIANNHIAELEEALRKFTSAYDAIISEDGQTNQMYVAYLEARKALEEVGE